MDELLSQFSISTDNTFSISNYVINIILCASLLFLLSLVYRKFGNSISNRGQLAKVLILVGLTTFIIISIVKSSLALSLGLVGALSIVRFRTAIKEPEELGYFFIAIATGLGMGANQLLPTIIGLAMVILTIILFRKNIFKDTLTQNLLITTHIKQENQTNATEKIAEIINQHASQVEVKRINYGKEEMDLNFLVKVKSLEKLNTIQHSLKEIDRSMSITFLDNTI
ncbi:MAG: DUF4956 domain-containing protein [Flavobacteriaceae bacterium]|jgi:uncharacterized membrane protein YhiD involved in acid resistance|nr:DUF4956 domain-containing protein [Flavobacteriaceae bacterium]MBT3919778.1 DUF4956 domain-containing protein [Flavobacteriaceae bacterium]MBT6704804.1 DUF4956 domain-containing protein [Flavobacteriaceae bacterium]MBT7243331.1 DUF4956 domain-containing protein [Flavobacteriaceae bacterium]|tara:strand:+ start:56 stop:733 length:678 start_codon:yes stop_codon:yes gene_type:complete